MRVQPGDPPAPTLALVSAVALHETLSALTADTTRSGDDGSLIIKWPNDILAGSSKLAGILLEGAGSAVVIGFGANLAHHPQGLERPVTSIASLAGSAPDPSEVADALATRFTFWLSRWRSDGLAPVREAWLAAAHPVGSRLSTSEGEGSFDGLEPGGALRLRLVDGSLRLVHAGDVFLL